MGERDLIVGLSREQATDIRDALAKDIYERLFSWLVNSINENISCSSLRAQNKTISLLDIFGFESFKVLAEL